MKFHGKIGFVESTEIRPDVWKEIPSEIEKSGDVIRKSNRIVDNATISDNIVINNQISIIADPYINQHFPSIRYVKWNGGYWRVTSVDQSNYPRLILSLGEVYNGPKVEPEQQAP